VETRFPHLTEEQRETLIDFFADRPTWREGSRSVASKGLGQIGMIEPDEDSIDVARKLAFEGRLAAAMAHQRRLADPATMWSSLANDPGRAGIVAPAVQATPSPAAAMPQAEEPWASMTPTQAAARFIADNPKITGDAKRRARWTDKARSQFEAAARLLEKSYGAKPLRFLVREDVVHLNAHFSRLPSRHHKARRHDPMTLEKICREAEAEVQAKKRDPSTIGLGPTTTNRHFLFLKDLVEWFGHQVLGTVAISWSDFVYEDDRDAREQRDACTEEEGRAMFRLPV